MRIVLQDDFRYDRLMLSIIVNDSRVDLSLPIGSLLDCVVAQLPICQQQQPFAIQVNGCFIPRSDYQHTQIDTNDKLDVLLAAPGG